MKKRVCVIVLICIILPLCAIRLAQVSAIETANLDTQNENTADGNTIEESLADENAKEEAIAENDVIEETPPENLIQENTDGNTGNESQDLQSDFVEEQSDVTESESQMTSEVAEEESSEEESVPIMGTATQFVRFRDESMILQVNVNEEKLSLADTVVTTSAIENITGIKVYDMSEDKTLGQELPVSKYTIDANYTVTFLEPITTAYVIAYETTGVSIHNTCVVTANMEEGTYIAEADDEFAPIQTKVTAGISNKTIFTDFRLYYTDTEEEIITGSVIPNEKEKITLEYAWSLSMAESVNANSYFSFKIQELFCISKATFGKIELENGTIVGTCYIDDTGDCTLLFNENADLSDEGILSINSVFDLDKASEDIALIVPVKEEDAVTIVLKKNGLDKDADESADESGLAEADADTDDEEITEANAKKVQYDPQPTTLQEVQTAIDTYNEKYQSVMADKGFIEALKVPKPHWKNKVSDTLMPSGFNCQLVEEDEYFKAKYYTFFSNPVTTAYGDGGFVNEPPVGPNIGDVFKIIVGNTAIDKVYPNVAIATMDAQNQFGAMWVDEKLDLTMPFTTDMYLHLGHSATPANKNAVADGMTFTMHNYPLALNAMIGGKGEGLGVYTGRTSNGIEDGSYLPNSLVIEFDTYINTGSTSTVIDPVSSSTTNYAHCALLYPRENSKLDPITASEHKNTYFFKPSQDWIPFTVKWEPEYSSNGVLGGTLTYSFNGVEQKETISDVNSVFNGTEVWWGFTGATGAQTAVQAAAIKKLPSPQYNLALVKSVKNQNGEDVDGKCIYAGETLTYTVKVVGTMTPGGSRIGTVNIEDVLSEYVEYDGAGVKMVTSVGSGPPILVESDYNSATKKLTVKTKTYLETSGDYLEITFNVKVKNDLVAGDVVKNTAVAEADNLEDPGKSNTTLVTIMEDATKKVTAGSEAGFDGAKVTIGNKITYEITYFNSTGGDDKLVITDPLPAGLSYVAGSATNGGIYDAVNHQIVWTFSSVTAGTGGSVKFTAEVTAEANRDTDLVNMALIKWDSGYKEEPSTKNPVEWYEVIYDGNGGATASSETTYSGGRFAMKSNYTVQGNDITGFALSGYTFVGWNTAADGSGVNYAPTDVISTVTTDIKLYARWGKDLVFRKIDAESMNNSTITPLTGAKFELFKCSHVHDASCGGIADPSSCTHTHIVLGETGTCWESSSYTASYGTDGITIFAGLMDGKYLLMETTAPNGYRLPKGQWIIESQNNVITFTGISGDADIPAVIPKGNFGGKENDDSVDFWIGNLKEYELPIAGHGGTRHFTVVGSLLLLIGTLMGTLYYRRKTGKNRIALYRRK